jgi:hypothetical protein
VSRPTSTSSNNKLYLSYGRTRSKWSVIADAICKRDSEHRLKWIIEKLTEEKKPIENHLTQAQMTEAKQLKRIATLKRKV